MIMYSGNSLLHSCINNIEYCKAFIMTQKNHKFTFDM